MCIWYVYMVPKIQNIFILVPGRQIPAGLSTVLDSFQLDSALSWIAFSWTQHCPGQLSARLSTVLDSLQLDSVLSWIAVSWTQHCPGQLSAGLSTVLYSFQHCPGQLSESNHIFIVSHLKIVFICIIHYTSYQ